MRTGLRDEQVWNLRVPARGRSVLEVGWRITGPGSGFVPELPALGLPASD